MAYYRFFLTLAALFLLGVGVLVILSRTARGESRCREAVYRVLLSLLGPLLVLLVGEGALLASNTTDGGLNLLVSRLWVQRNVRLNELGLRGPLPLSPPPGTPPRIASAFWATRWLSARVSRTKKTALGRCWVNCSGAMEGTWRSSTSAARAGTRPAS